MLKLAVFTELLRHTSVRIFRPRKIYYINGRIRPTGYVMHQQV